MAKKLPLTSFSLRVIFLHYLSLFAITLRHVKTDTSASKFPQQFTFFMHDILGGSTPSERIVSGVIVDTTTQTSNNLLPFSKPNNRVFPIKGAIPIVDTTNVIINGSPTTTSTMVMIRNIDKNRVVIGRDSLPYVTPNQLPPGATLGNLLFGRITVIDDEITKGHDLGSEVIGKAQGFHLASSLDGSSRTMAFTALLVSESEGGRDEDDAVSFFGVHRTATPESYIAVVGGTGKYEDARGYAKIETVQLPNQHPTNNGLETLLRITVYLS